MFKILVSMVILIIPLVIGQELCTYIIRNGIYDGLGIYHRMISPKNLSYVMFNKFGNEWRFEVGQPSRMGIALIEDSVKAYDTTNIVNRFSTYKSLNVYTSESCDCILTSNPGRHELNMFCNEFESQTNENNDYNFTDSVFGNRVIMKGQPSVTNDDSVKRIHMYKKADKREDYDHIIVNGCIDRNQIVRCSAGHQNSYCQKGPEFVRQIDPKLFKSIEGVVDFKFNKGKSGHLLLFNISGRPKYCFTFEGEDLSEDCKSPENMKPLFVECFPLTDSTTINPNSNPTNSPTHKIETKNIMFWIILSIVIIILAIIVVIVGVRVCCKKPKTGPSSIGTAFDSVHTGTKTLTIKEQPTTLSDVKEPINKSLTKEVTQKSPLKGTQFKTSVKTTQSQAKPSTKATQLPKTSVKPSQSPKI